MFSYQHFYRCVSRDIHFFSFSFFIYISTLFSFLLFLYPSAVYLCLVYLYLYIYIYTLLSFDRTKQICLWMTIYIYIYIYIYLLRKTKSGHFRIMNLFPSCYEYWYESITPNLTGLLQILMDIMNTARMDTGEKGVKGVEEFPPHFDQFRFFFRYRSGS